MSTERFVASVQYNWRPVDRLPCSCQDGQKGNPGLNERVQDKDKRMKDSSLSKQFLLIVTDEPWLGEATLSEYLKVTKLQPPRNFDDVAQGSYTPNPAGKERGYYPVFEVPLAE